AATARSISPASRMLTGFTSTLSDGATAWIAANSLVPEPWAASRRTAARVTPGATCLSSSSLFPPMLYSNVMKPILHRPKKQEEHANAPHALPLLRARRERPRGRRAAEQRDELATLHSITSSARASSVGGSWRPSAFAVVRLITSSYFVGV